MSLRTWSAKVVFEGAKFVVVELLFLRVSGPMTVLILILGFVIIDLVVQCLLSLLMEVFTSLCWD